MAPRISGMVYCLPNFLRVHVRLAKSNGGIMIKLTLIQRFDGTVIVIDHRLQKWPFDTLKNAEKEIDLRAIIIRHIHPSVARTNF